MTLGSNITMAIDHHSEGKKICNCFGVPESEIVDAIKTYNIKGVDQVTKRTRGGGGCGSCRKLIRKIIDHVREHEGLDLIEATKYQQAKNAKPMMPMIKQLRLIGEIVDQHTKKCDGKIAFNGIVDGHVEIVFTEIALEAQATLIAQLQKKIDQKINGSLIVIAK